MQRASENKQKLFIIVEVTFSEVLSGYEYSNFKGISMIRKLMTLWLRYKVQTIFTKDRYEMSNYITEFFLACERDYMRCK